LLFVGMSKGELLAMSLSYLAPLPIVIATLGWGVDIGGIAAAIAIGGVAAFFEPLSGLLFAASVAAPAWLLAAIIAVPIERIPLLNRRLPGQRGYLSISFIMSVVIAIGALAGIAALATLTLPYASYAEGVSTIAGKLLPQFTEALGEEALSGGALPGEMNIAEFVTLFVRLWPALVAGSTVILLCVNLYLGARAVQLSQRLSRPWTAVPEGIRLAPAYGAVFLICIVVGVIASGAPRHLALVGAGLLAAAYALQGFAVAHALSRGLSFRAPLLACIYLACLFAPPLIVAVGLAESLLSLRARRAASARP
jgi:hypothetical protein